MKRILQRTHITNNPHLPSSLRDEPGPCSSWGSNRRRKGRILKEKPIFWSLSEILQGIKSTTAHKINKAAGVTGVHVWQEESFDRLIRGDSDLEEKFHYICRNPWDNGIVPLAENYRWLWTPDAAVAGRRTFPARAGITRPDTEALPNLALSMRFKLYDDVWLSAMT